MLVKVLSAFSHNGVVVESSSDQLHVAMRANFAKVRRLAPNHLLRKSCTENKFQPLILLNLQLKTAEFAKFLQL